MSTWKVRFGVSIGNYNHAAHVYWTILYMPFFAHGVAENSHMLMLYRKYYFSYQGEDVRKINRDWYSLGYYKEDFYPEKIAGLSELCEISKKVLDEKMYEIGPRLGHDFEKHLYSFLDELKPSH
jgi:hypothetical protein